MDGSRILMSDVKDTILPWLITAMITANFGLMYEMSNKIGDIKLRIAENTKYISAITLIQRDVEINTARIHELESKIR